MCEFYDVKFSFQVHASGRTWPFWYCINIVHWNCKSIHMLLFSRINCRLKHCDRCRYGFVLGYEALFLLELVRQFTEICICIFPSDIIISWDVCVREHFFFNIKWLLQTFPNLSTFLHLFGYPADLYTWVLILPWNSIVGPTLDSSFSLLYPWVINQLEYKLLLFCFFQ